MALPPAKPPVLPRLALASAPAASTLAGSPAGPVAAAPVPVASAPGPGADADAPGVVAGAPKTSSRQTSRRSARQPAAQKRRRAALALDLAAVAGIDGLAEEVALLRASIRKLADGDVDGDDVSEQVKVLAELRHQVEALCTVLKTQQALIARADVAGADDLARVLDELGDALGAG